MRPAHCCVIHGRFIGVVSTLLAVVVHVPATGIAASSALPVAATPTASPDKPLTRAEFRQLLLDLRDPSPQRRIAVMQFIETNRVGKAAGRLRWYARHDPDPAARRQAKRTFDIVYPYSRRPGMAAGLGSLCPGCGHFYLGKKGEGAAWLGTSVGLMVGGLVGVLSGGSTSLLEQSGSAGQAIGLQLMMAGQNAWFYSAFDAYRQARLGRDDRGYRHPISRESLADLASAPFRPSVLKSPWVWAGVPLMLGAGLGLMKIAGKFPVGQRTLLDGGRVNFLGAQMSPAAGIVAGELYYAALFDPVAVGEEALFRGVLQSALMEDLGDWTGWVLASLAFGAIHSFNFLLPGQEASDALWAVPFITVVGSTMGLAYMQTGNRLSTSVAMHFWYDFLLGTTSFIADPDNQPFVVKATIPF